MIKFDNVSFSYNGKPVIKEFTLQIKEGDRICFFGESGIGKTTLLRLIAGLEKADSGSLSVSEGATFSVTFQEDRLLSHISLLENVLLFDNTGKAHEHIEALGLSKSEGLYPSELSGGMARRAAIARALSREADIYLFDEALSGLDSENEEIAAKHILNSTKGKTFIMVSHNLRHAEMLGCRIIDLNKIL